MILVFICYALLASAFWVNKLILYHLPATLFVGIRHTLSGLLLLGYLLILFKKLSWKNIRQDWLKLLVIPLCATYLCTILKAFANKNMPVTKACLLGSIDPFVTAILAYILLHERLSVVKILGILVGFAGALLVIIGRSSPGETIFCTELWTAFSYPEIAAIAAVITGRYGWMLVQQILRRNRYSTLEINGLMMLVGGTYAFITSLYVDQSSFATLQPSWSLVGLMAYTIIVGNIIGYSLFGYLLKRYSSTFISLAGFSVPVFVQFFDWALSGHPLSWTFLIALAIMILGAFIFYSEDLRNRKKSSQEALL